MNSFYEHHKGSIHWHYRCFDRILLNGLIQPFQQPERVVGFFNTYRQRYPVTRYTLRGIADQFQRWVTERAEKRNIPLVEAPKGRHDEYNEPYLERRSMTRSWSSSMRENRADHDCHRRSSSQTDGTPVPQRWVIQYNFCINDWNWGRRSCGSARTFHSPPVSVSIQHHWLANRMAPA